MSLPFHTISPKILLTTTHGKLDYVNDVLKTNGCSWQLQLCCTNKRNNIGIGSYRVGIRIVVINHPKRRARAEVSPKYTMTTTQPPPRAEWHPSQVFKRSKALSDFRLGRIASGWTGERRRAVTDSLARHSNSGLCGTWTSHARGFKRAQRADNPRSELIGQK